MRKGNFLAAILAILVVGASGCGDTPKNVIEPPLGPGGKADVADRVQMLGEIKFGGEVTGEFVEDLQFDAYTFYASDNARITIETTHKGSSQSLDNTLFIYGPANESGKYGTSHIASDDDSGYSRHAKIASFSLTEGGRYLVVTGTPSGTGRGNYRLELRCDSGDCETLDHLLTTCDEDMYSSFQECVEETMNEFEVEVGDAIVAEVIEDCIARDIASEHYDMVCDSSSPKPWCAAGFDAVYEQMIPECRTTLKADYFVVDPLEAQVLDVPAEIMEMVNDASDQLAYDDENSALDAMALSYTWDDQGVPGMDRVAETAIRFADLPGFADYQGEIAKDEFTSDIQDLHLDMPAFLDSVAEWGGSENPAVGEIFGCQLVDEYNEEFVNAYVIAFRDNHHVFVIIYTGVVDS